MKHKVFKIENNTLFVYKTKKNPSNPTGTTTDPTTTTMTVTQTSGIQFRVGLK